MSVRTIVAAVALAVAAGGGAIAAQAPLLAALGILEPGLWQLKEADGATRRICVTDLRMLVQVQHGNAQCSRYVIADNPRSATVHYTCPGAGHGRTTIDVVGGGQFHMQTQGILDGAPFDTEYEGRRVGKCGLPSAALR